jgi:hypothetical protein
VIIVDAESAIKRLTLKFFPLINIEWPCLNRSGQSLVAQFNQPRFKLRQKK